MSKQAKNILVKQFKVHTTQHTTHTATRCRPPHPLSPDLSVLRSLPPLPQDQISSLLSELDEQKAMLAEDDDTISTLRQAIARWEHGDQAGALAIQQRITNEHDARELQRQLKHLESHAVLREKQMLDVKEENARLVKLVGGGTAAGVEGEAAAGAAVVDGKGGASEVELAAAQHRVAQLEREVAELTVKARELQAHSAQLDTKVRRASVADTAATSERTLLTHKVAQLEAAMAMHKRVMETQQREVEEAKAAAATRGAGVQAAVVVAAPVAGGPTVREAALEAEVRGVRGEVAALEFAVKAKEEEVRLVKEKAKEKLNTASDAVKKMKAEYATLRSAYTRVKQDGAAQAVDVQQRWRGKLQRMAEAVQLAKSELADVRVQMQTMTANLLPSLRPMLTRHVHSIGDHFKAETAALALAYRKEQLTRKALFNQLQELKGNIRVYCRVRPLSAREKDSDVSGVTFPDVGQLTVANPEKKSVVAFEFDQVFGMASRQEEVFAEVAELVTSVMDGYNVCIFAYGQTGSGKTHTMQGPRDDPGVNIRALEKLFVTAREREVDTVYSIRITLLEIYMEKVVDLLSPQGSTGQQLKVVQGAQGMEVQELTYAAVHSLEEVLDALEKGSRTRRVSSTAMNADSSRSHLILSVYVVGKSRFGLTGAAGKEVVGKLHLIDLAGSERVGRSGVTGEGLKEAQSINSSLSALGNCIAARANRAAHVPYRDSTLTYLLQDSLEKNSKTLMFVQVSPNTSDAGESICSLRFAERVRKVELGKATANVKKT